MAISSSFSPPNDATSMTNMSQNLTNLPADSEIWESLKQAIAASSGFKRWQLEQAESACDMNAGLDDWVRRYLRETLETLAY